MSIVHLFPHAEHCCAFYFILSFQSHRKARMFIVVAVNIFTMTFINFLSTNQFMLQNQLKYKKIRFPGKQYVYGEVCQL